jgi:NAD(P)-dependent dehydrogenase (short-subunit alcohol dehydrogenase family)
MTQTGPLSERVAVVSGGSRGIGRGVAESLLKRGASVMIAARTPDQVATAADELSGLGPVAGIVCDVSDAAAVDDLVQRTVQRFGRLDIAACCAGVYGRSYSVLEYPDKLWDKVIAINLTGSFLLGRAAARAMVKCDTDAGRIVMISSVDAVVAEPNCTPYNASKAAIHGLIRGMAVDLAAYPITCNAVAPGWIATPMTAESLPPAVLAGEAPFELALSGRIGMPSDIGEAVAWLADPASSFVNGSAVMVDGGQTAKSAMPSAWEREQGPQETG